MEIDSNIEVLVDGAKSFGVDIDYESANKFMVFANLLIEWNKKFNLTSITNIKDIILKHFLDSLSIFPDICSTRGKMIDIGAGAGFPGIPLRIAIDNANMLLVDSIGKKVVFMNEAIKHLGLSNVNALKARAEELGRDREYREKYDAAFARAVSSLPVIIEYCLPFLKTGGVFIAMRGKCVEDIRHSGKALKELGGEIEEIRNIILPSSDIERTILKARKVRQTSRKYPRKTGKPTISPIK
jgi:16S rRNA (guanine527-N7)-methyltransferase